MAFTVYVAQPIDQVDRLDIPWWRTVVDFLPRILRDECGELVAFHPAKAFIVGRGTQPSPELEVINRAALAVCDAVLAFVPAGVPTIGVPREIEWARLAGKPVIALTDLDGSWSLVDVLTFPIEVESIPLAISQLKAMAGHPLSTPVVRDLPFSVVCPGQLPTRSHGGDAGFDLYVSRSVVIEPHSFADVHTDVRVALPDGVWARITGRSSTIRKRGLLIAEGIIDTGYRGELFTGVWNLTNGPVEVDAGDRIAQLVLHTNVAADFRAAVASPAEFDEIPHDGRGAAGFGSTGV